LGESGDDNSENNNEKKLSKALDIMEKSKVLKIEDVLPYITDLIIRKNKSCFKIIGIMIVMFLVGFINPYTYENVLMKRKKKLKIWKKN